MFNFGYTVLSHPRSSNLLSKTCGHESSAALYLNHRCDAYKQLLYYDNYYKRTVNTTREHSKTCACTYARGLRTK